MKPYKIAVINSHPIQYFGPLYTYLNKVESLDITVLFCSDVNLRSNFDEGFEQEFKWDIDLLSGYYSKFLGNRSRKRKIGGFWSLIAPEVWLEIRRGKYDALWLHGYTYAAYIIALLAAKSKGIPVFLRTETHLGLKRTTWNKKKHNFLASIFFTFIDSFLAIGTANKKYYLSFGIPKEKIFDVPYTVDNDRFITSSSISDEERKSLLKNYGLPHNKPILLFASKFMRRKNPHDLLQAASILQNQGYDFSLFMVGSGEMEEELHALVRELKLNSVVFSGFVNQSEIPLIYRISDVFILPSEDEPWGLVVNEVMCSSLAIVISEEVGCAEDLLKDGINGYHFKAGNKQLLAAKLAELLSNQELMREMGRQSFHIINDWNYEKCKKGLLKAVDMVKKLENIN